MPFKSGRFDFVTCLGSLERMLDRPRALQEMRRVARQEAKFCFLVRNSNTLTWRWLAGSEEARRSRGHQDARSLVYWRTLFESAGLQVLDVFPDQYPLQRRERWLKLGIMPVDYRTPRRARRPLESANEFVFLLGNRR